MLIINEISYRSIMDNLIDSMMSFDVMMRESMGLNAFVLEDKQRVLESLMQTIPNLESVQSELEKIQATHNSLEKAMNSPVIEAIRNEDRIFAGVTGGLLDVGSKNISAIEGMREIASLKNSFEELAATSFVSHVSEIASFENSLAKNLVEDIGINRLPELALIQPYKSECPKILPEVTLSPKTIEELAETIAQKGGRIEITATNRSVVIAGDASNSEIDTSDIISYKKS